MNRTIGVLVIVLSLGFAIGCGKKEEPVQPTEQQTQGMMDQAAQTVKETVATAAAEVKQAFTTEINLDKSVADLKAEAEKMDVASLTAVAVKYKDAIAAKQAELKVVSDKLAAIPMTQKLGDEAKQLTVEVQKLTESIKPLKERFDVYLSAITAKGGDVSSLK